MFKANLNCWVVCAAVTVLCHFLPASDMSAPNFVIEVSSDKLPAYDFAIANPLEATMAGYLYAKPVKIENERRMDLRVPGFHCKLPVMAVVQNHPAPLVVVLPGLSGSPDDPFSRVWPAWYAEAGYHVLTFDSSFTAKFNEASRHGISGNLWRESELVRDVISAFMATKCLEGKVTKLGLVGMSYGGVQVLMLRQMEAQGKVPFKIDAVQAWSAPVNLEHSARIMSDWLKCDRPRYTIYDFAYMLLLKPGQHEYPDSQMRAAIAESFRESVAYVLVQNDSRYGLHALQRGNEFDDKEIRYDSAMKYTFTDYAYNIAYPYWQNKLHLDSLQPLIDAADVCALIQGRPACTEIIIANDDPLNRPEDIARLKECAGKSLTLLPNGGHMGYLSEGWTHMKLLTLFQACNGVDAKAAAK